VRMRWAVPVRHEYNHPRKHEELLCYWVRYPDHKKLEVTSGKSPSRWTEVPLVNVFEPLTQACGCCLLKKGEVPADLPENKILTRTKF